MVMGIHKILLVEDNSSVRNVIRQSLLKEGHVVFEASNGIEALKILQKQTVDLMITDQKMPSMDASELIFNARKFIDKYLVITGYPSELGIPNLPVLNKPITDQKLHNKIFDIMNAG